MNKDKIVIRPLHPNDTAAIYEMITNPLIAEMMNILPSMEYGENEEWLAQSRPGTHRFVAEQAGKVIGNGNLYHFQRARLFHAGTISLMVYPAHWQQGIATTFINSVLTIADNWLNLKRVDLEVNTDNPAGIRLYQKFGFEIEGTKRFHTYGDGRWADSHYMARIR
jgi:L-phenylalanine/L-methionine N-acetyltransferase